MYEALWHTVASVALIVVIAADTPTLAQSGRGAASTTTVNGTAGPSARNEASSTIPVLRGSGLGASQSPTSRRRSLTSPHLTNAQIVAVRALVGDTPAAFTLTPRNPDLPGKGFLWGFHWDRYHPNDTVTGNILFGGGNSASSLYVHMDVAAGIYLLDFTISGLAYLAQPFEGCRYEIQLLTGPVQTFSCLSGGQHILVAVDKPSGAAVVRVNLRSDSGNASAVFQSVSVTPVP
jgi:hypothetical protein